MTLQFSDVKSFTFDCRIIRPEYFVLSSRPFKLHFYWYDKSSPDYSTKKEIKTELDYQNAVQTMQAHATKFKETYHFRFYIEKEEYFSLFQIRSLNRWAAVKSMKLIGLFTIR